MNDTERIDPYELAEQLRSCIAHLREDVTARADPILTEIAHALELMVNFAMRVHEDALESRARIEELEARGSPQA